MSLGGVMDSVVYSNAQARRVGGQSVIAYSCIHRGLQTTAYIHPAKVESLKLDNYTTSIYKVTFVYADNFPIPLLITHRNLLDPFFEARPDLIVDL